MVSGQFRALSTKADIAEEASGASPDDGLDLTTAVGCSKFNWIGSQREGLAHTNTQQLFLLQGKRYSGPWIFSPIGRKAALSLGKTEPLAVSTLALS